MAEKNSHSSGTALSVTARVRANTSQRKIKTVPRDSLVTPWINQAQRPHRTSPQVLQADHTLVGYNVETRQHTLCT